MDRATSALTLEEPGDALRRMVDDTIRVWEPVWQSWSGVISAWPQAGSWAPEQVGGGSERHRHGHHHGHHHGHGHAHGPSHENGHEHGCCEDACDCGVGAADLVVRTRVGETRIVPLSITNRWRRERTVEVAIGPFTPGCHEDALVQVTATARPDGPITLAPCERTEVAILLSTAPIRREDRKAEETSPKRRNSAAERSTAEESDSKQSTSNEQRGGPPDVGCSVTMYADVTVAGCRSPLRLAVVVLPLHCGAYRVSCDCGCC